MSKKLTAFIQDLNTDHKKVVQRWKTRQKVCNALLMLFVCLLLIAAGAGVMETFDGTTNYLLVLGTGAFALCLVIVCDADADAYDWSRTLVEAGRCVEFETLLHGTRIGSCSVIPKDRPLYVADYAALKEQCDQLSDTIFDGAEFAAASRLGQAE